MAAWKEGDQYKNIALKMHSIRDVMVRVFVPYRMFVSVCDLFGSVHPVTQKITVYLSVIVYSCHYSHTQKSNSRARVLLRKFWQCTSCCLLDVVFKCHSDESLLNVYIFQNKCYFQHFFVFPAV